MQQQKQCANERLRRHVTKPRSREWLSKQTRKYVHRKLDCSWSPMRANCKPPLAGYEWEGMLQLSIQQPSARRAWNTSARLRHRPRHEMARGSAARAAARPSPESQVLFSCRVVTLATVSGEDGEPKPGEAAGEPPGHGAGEA